VSDLGHPTRALRPFAGTRRRVELRRERVGGPLAGELVLAELRMEGETATGAQLQLDVSWDGLLPGTLPPSPGVRPGRATDSLVLHELALANAVLGRAGEQLRAGEAPDLRALAGQLKRRD
jgi:hypothetical protein